MEQSTDHDSLSCRGLWRAFGLVGYWTAVIWDSSIAGAIVVVAGLILLSLLFSPNQGVIARLWQRVTLSVQVAQDHMLLALCGV